MQHNQKTTVRKLYRLSYALGVLFLALGMLLTTVGQPVFASVAASVNQIDTEWDKSSLLFDDNYGCQGNCQEVRARVCNGGSAMQGTTTYNVYYHPTGNPMSGDLVYTGIIPQLAAGQCTILTYSPASNPLPEGSEGNYKFQFIQRPGHPGTGAGWSATYAIALCPLPTPTFTVTATKTATFTPTATNTATNTATFTPTSTFTATFTPTSTFTATFTPTSTFTATFTPTSTFTATWTPVPPTATPTNTLEPTPTDTVEPTPTNTVEPTPTNTLEPTPTNTVEPTPTNTVEPTPTNTVEPTPTDVVPTPTPVETQPEPTPTEVEPTPTPVETQPEPTPTSVEPTPTVVVSETPTDPSPTPGETEPPTDPTPLPSLPPPPRSTPSVLIPVTGADNSASFPLDGKLFTNIGLMFLGLAFVTQGLSRRNK